MFSVHLAFLIMFSVVEQKMLLFNYLFNLRYYLKLSVPLYFSFQLCKELNLGSVVKIWF